MSIDIENRHGVLSISMMRMEVETFRYSRDAEKVSAPYQAHLFFAELQLVDFVEP